MTMHAVRSGIDGQNGQDGLYGHYRWHGIPSIRFILSIRSMRPILSIGSILSIVSISSILSPTPVAASPTTSRSPSETMLHVTVRDRSTSLPVSQFHVTAGADPAVREPKNFIVNWGWHTVRTGRDGKIDCPIVYDPMALRIEAEGYEPASTSWFFRKDGSRDISIALSREQGISGRVLTPDGAPASSATLALAMIQRDARLTSGGRLIGVSDPLPQRLSDRLRRPQFVQTDEQGRFHVPHLNDATAAVLIIHDSGAREMAFTDFEVSADEIRLRPWGRVEGHVLWKDKPGVHEDIALGVYRETYGYSGIVSQYETTVTDENGQFVIERVLPGRVQISRIIRVNRPEGVSDATLDGLVMHTDVKCGEPTRVLLGGRGRIVKGKLTGRKSWAGILISFSTPAPHIGMPGDDVQWEAAARNPVDRLFHQGNIKPNADGSFEITAVLPGNYDLQVGVNQAWHQFTVPPESPDSSPPPLDLGEIAVKPE